MEKSTIGVNSSNTGKTKKLEGGSLTISKAQKMKLLLNFIMHGQ